MFRVPDTNAALTHSVYVRTCQFTVEEPLTVKQLNSYELYNSLVTIRCTVPFCALNWELWLGRGRDGREVRKSLVLVIYAVCFGNLEI